MVKASSRIEYSDFEHIMIHLAGERGWTFKFGDESVPVEAVFNHSTYAPALLAAAETELAARRIGGDLAFALEGEGNSLFGARVRFGQRAELIPKPVLANGHHGADYRVPSSIRQQHHARPTAVRAGRSLC